jgi:hypothetical protein
MWQNYCLHVGIRIIFWPTPVIMISLGFISSTVMRSECKKNRLHVPVPNTEKFAMRDTLSH